MSQYAAPILGVLGLMFFLLELGFRLPERHEALRFFMMMMAAVTGAVAGHLTREVAVDSAISAAAIAAVGYAYWVYVVSMIIVFFYFLWHFLQEVLLLVKDRKRRVRL